MLILSIIISIISIIACPLIAADKGRSVGGWIVGAIFLGLIGLIIIACLPPIEEKNTDGIQIRRTSTRTKSRQAVIPYCETCFHSISSTDTECPYCGAKLADQRNNKKTKPVEKIRPKYISNTCPVCYKTVSEKDEICPHCGCGLR